MDAAAGQAEPDQREDKNMDRDWKKLPKIELHCHLDGSVSPELAQELLARRGEHHSLEELKELLQAPEDCMDLSEYLRRFDLPNYILQTREELSSVAYDLAGRAAKEQVRYLECRFAPVFSTAEGLRVRQVLEAVKDGFERAGKDYGIQTGIIVCAMRGLSESANLSMLRESMELYGCGVVGCDLAGDEMAYPVGEFAYFFEKARAYGIPFTIHAGEQGSRENIRGSIELGARRIGHGIAMLGDRKLQQLCADRRIGVELCPTSNLQTKAISSFANYPFREFLDAGIQVSVNTDNRTVSGTDMAAEFALLAGQFPMTDEELRRIYTDSVEVSFASDEVKDRLLKENTSFYD